MQFFNLIFAALLFTNSLKVHLRENFMFTQIIITIINNLKLHESMKYYVSILNYQKYNYEMYLHVNNNFTLLILYNHVSIIGKKN